MTLRIAGVLAAMAMAATAQPGASVQGRAISSLHGEPVAHAMVTLRELQAFGAAKPQVYICETGADGRFSIADVALAGTTHSHRSRATNRMRRTAPQFTTIRRSRWKPASR